MNEKDVGAADGTDLEGGALHDQIGHWMAVLDRWIKQFDSGVGGQAHKVGALDSDDGRRESPSQAEEDGRNLAPGVDS